MTTQSGLIEDGQSIITREIDKLDATLKEIDAFIAETRPLTAVEKAEPFLRITGRRVVAIYTPERGLVVASELAS